MKTRFAGLSFALLTAGFFGLAGCGGGGGDEMAADTTAVDTSMTTTDMDREEVAVAMLEPTEGNTARGTVRFTALDGAFRVEADLTGVPPGEHGFHVHENGDCSNNAEAAGGHFNPQGHPHGAPDAPVGQRHVGDFGNVEAGADSSVTFERVDSLIAFQGASSVIGKAVVLHAGADDLQSQPSGDSGARIACGVVQMEGDDMGMMPDTSAADPTAL